MRTLYTFFLGVMIFFSIGSQDLFAVKLKNVTQTGTGNSGSVKIEFNNDYNKSNISLNYSADKVELIIPNAFVVPVKRVFKSSSAKSSVIKMEAANISGRSLRLSIYFRSIPIDIIKKTAKLTDDGNVVTFSYATSAEEAIAAAVAKPQTPPEPVVEPAVAKQEPIVVKAEKKEDKKKEENIQEPAKDDGVPLLAKIKKQALALAGFFKIAVLFILLCFVVYALLYIVRKYSRTTFIDKTDDQPVFGSTKVTRSKPQMLSSDIKVINSLEIEKDKKLYVVEVMGERMLIGSGKDYMSMLSRLQNETKDGQGSLFNNDNPEQGLTEQQVSVMRTRLKDKLGNF